TGYDHSPEGQEGKKQRDLRLLQLEVEDDPSDSFTLFNLGMTYNDIGQYQEAIDFLERCLAVSGPDETHLRKAYALLVYAYSQSGQQRAARDTSEAGLVLFPKDPELKFRKA